MTTTLQALWSLLSTPGSTDALGKRALVSTGKAVPSEPWAPEPQGENAWLRCGCRDSCCWGSREVGWGGGPARLPGGQTTQPRVCGVPRGLAEATPTAARTHLSGRKSDSNTKTLLASRKAARLLRHGLGVLSAWASPRVRRPVWVRKACGIQLV